jgi:hypothetical protein
MSNQKQQEQIHTSIKLKQSSQFKNNIFKIIWNK